MDDEVKPEDIPAEAVAAYALAWEAERKRSAMEMPLVPGAKTRAGLAAALNVLEARGEIAVWLT